MVSSSQWVGRMCKSGDVIYNQGESGDCMYVVQTGHVEIIQRKGNNEYCLAVAGEGDFFGEMALFGYPIRSATARAAGHGAVILSLEKKTFLKRMHYDPSLAFDILKKMADRIQHLEKELVEYGESTLPPELQ